MREMDQEQIDFREEWKRRHGRMKGANQAYKRHLVRKRRKINKRVNK